VLRVETMYVNVVEWGSEVSFPWLCLACHAHRFHWVEGWKWDTCTRTLHCCVKKRPKMTETGRAQVC
jgi:hypothetical protein